MRGQLFSAKCGVASKSAGRTNVWSPAVPAQPPDDDLATLWERARADLAASLPAATFDLWFEPVSAVSVAG